MRFPVGCEIELGGADKEPQDHHGKQKKVGTHGAGLLVSGGLAPAWGDQSAGL
jgi:hypothetical protein